MNNKFLFDFYNYATSVVNDKFCDFPIVIMLQALDGLYDKLPNKKLKKEYFKTDVCSNLRKEILSVDIQKYELGDKQTELLKKKLNDCLAQLNKVDFKTKLEIMFNYADEKYGIFKLEREFENGFSLPELIEKCKKLRNMYSHSFSTKSGLSSIESVFYIYKFVLVFRILIMESIKLDTFINKDFLSYEIEITDDIIKEELNFKK